MIGAPRAHMETCSDGGAVCCYDQLALSLNHIISGLRLHQHLARWPYCSSIDISALTIATLTSTIQHGRNRGDGFCKASLVERGGCLPSTLIANASMLSRLLTMSYQGVSSEFPIYWFRQPSRLGRHQRCDLQARLLQAPRR